MGHRARRLARGAEGCGVNCEEMADRMGLIYMARAGYDPAAALTVLATILRDGTWLDGLSGRQAVNADRLACLRMEVAQVTAAPPAPGPAEMVAPACRPSPDPETLPSTQ
jgi:predicted Zn-dependent protease